MKNWFQFIVSISLIVFCVSTFAIESEVASPYARIVSFGDSLSDLGTYGMAAGPVGGGKFTTNPGKIWVEVIAAKLGLEVKPKRQEGFGLPVRELGGFNYAQGGSRVVAPRAKADDEAASATARPVVEQVSMFLAEYKAFNATDLVLIQGGANDLFAQLTNLKAGKITPEQAVQNMIQTANELALIIAQLKASGAQKLVVVNLPAIEQTPKMSSLNPQTRQLIKLMVVSFNTTLAQQTSAMGILLVDFYHFDLDFNANYQNLGFKNISTPACKNSIPTSSSLFCSGKTLIEVGADLTYKFADDVHPATGFSKVAGEFIYSEIMK